MRLKDSAWHAWNPSWRMPFLPFAVHAKIAAAASGPLARRIASPARNGSLISRNHGATFLA
jgi:hypothetical protein